MNTSSTLRPRQAGATGNELAMTTSASATPGSRPPLVTPRLRLRGWQMEDAPAALAVYGHEAVTRWLSPAMDRVPDLAAMRHGYASEATYTLCQWAFRHNIDELLAVVRPGNTRAAATVRRNSMHWVAETAKYAQFPPTVG